MKSIVLGIKAPTSSSASTNNIYSHDEVLRGFNRMSLIEFDTRT